MTLAEFVTLFDQFNRANRMPGTAGFYRFNLYPLVVKWGGLDAAAFRPFHLLQFKATWHRIMAVQRLYSWGVEQELVVGNPFAKMRRPRLGARRRVLTRQELMRLLRHSRADFRRFLLAARETAARPQELRELTWAEMAMPADTTIEDGLPSGLGYFVVNEFKGRKRRSDAGAYRTIPISPRLGRLMLRLLRKGRVEGRVFLRDGGGDWNYGQLRGRMTRLRKKAGVLYELHGERVSCYTLRHSTATTWASKGLQTSVLQGLLGHANIRTTQRYVHLSREQLLAAWRLFHRKG